jgi:hypothetical protein
MAKIGDIKDKVVIVDYVPASHGHFIIDTLHSLMLNRTSIDESIGNKNYHHSSVIPQPVLWGQTLEQNINSVEFINDSWISDCDKLFCPSHWSNYWLEKRLDKQHIKLLKRDIDNYPMIEIYVGKEFYFRWLINWWFNVGTVPKDSIADNRYFVDNFYKISQDIQSTRMFTTAVSQAITTNPENHRYTTVEVISMLEEMIKIAHSNTYVAGNTWPQRPLKSFYLTNKIISFDMAQFYSYNKFVAMITKIKNFFALQFDVNEEYLKHTWIRFINNQYPIQVYNESVPDNNLHVIEQAYRSFLKKCKPQ